MKTTLAILTIAVSLPIVASAEEAAPKAPGYQLKNRSSFSAAEDSRAPFWPIGWSRRVAQAAPTNTTAPVAAKVAIDANNYKITSILLGSPSLAVINGRAYGEGEYIKSARPAEGAATEVATAPKIRVQQISDSAVVLTLGEQAVTVRFNRQSLALKSRAANPLLQDR